MIFLIFAKYKNMAKELILIFGLPGVGKTSIANKIVAQKSLFLATTEVVRSAILSEKYVIEDRDFTENEIMIVYNAMELISNYLLESHQSILIDGVYRSIKERKRIYDLAKKHNVKLSVFYIYCNEDINMDRLIKRKQSGKTNCPAGINTFKKIKNEFDFPNVTEDVYEISNDNELEKAVDEIINLL